MFCVEKHVLENKLTTGKKEGTEKYKKKYSVFWDHHT